MDGIIHNQLWGKTIVNAFKDDEHLILETTDGHQVRIGWVEGEPEHIRTDVKIQMPHLSAVAGVGRF